eukprot:gene23261-30489_t
MIGTLATGAEEARAREPDAEALVPARPLAEPAGRMLTKLLPHPKVTGFLSDAPSRPIPVLVSMVSMARNRAHAQWALASLVLLLSCGVSLVSGGAISVTSRGSGRAVLTTDEPWSSCGSSDSADFGRCKTCESYSRPNGKNWACGDYCMADSLVGSDHRYSEPCFSCVEKVSTVEYPHGIHDLEWQGICFDCVMNCHDIDQCVYRAENKLAIAGCGKEPTPSEDDKVDKDDDCDDDIPPPPPPEDDCDHSTPPPPPPPPPEDDCDHSPPPPPPEDDCDKDDMVLKP